MAKNNYIDNKEFYAAMVNFIAARREDPSFPVSSYIGKCLLDISHRIVFRPNFINYSYRDEMEGDALENLVRYVDRFDPERSKNPFAYFSQIAFFACVRRIQKEQQQMETKAALVQSGSLYHSAIDHMTEEEDEYFDPESMSNLEYLYSYEIKPKVKKQKKEKPRTESDLLLFAA